METLFGGAKKSRPIETGRPSTINYNPMNISKMKYSCAAHK